MWYFSWVLGLGFAVTLAVLNAMWLEQRSMESDRRE
jgi:cyd operon protein YbgT